MTARFFVVGAGAIVALVVAIVPYIIWDPSSRPEAFGYSTSFLALQVVVFFAGFGFIPGGFSVVRMGVGTVCGLYNIVAVATVIAFHLLPVGMVAPRIYYAVTVSETALAVAVALLLGLVGVAHREGNRSAESARSDVEALRGRADRLAARLASRGHAAIPARRLQDAMRFCEGLRRDPTLVDETHRRLAELEEASAADGALPGDLDQRIGALTALIEGQP